MKSLGMVAIESVRPNKWNVNAISDEEYAKLRKAIRASGPERMEPITVRRAEDGTLEIVNGEQRWKIAKELGWKDIPAVEVEVDRKTAKFLCLSYNALRGTVNFVKLAELVQADPEMVEAVAAVYGEDEVKRLKGKAESLTDEAKKVLEESIRKGGIVTPKVIETVAQAPKDVQHQIAQATAVSKEALEDFVESEVQKRTQPTVEEEEEEEGEETTLEEAVEVGEKGVEVEPKRAEAVKTYQLAAYVKIDGQPYLVYYDPERRVIGVKRYKIDYDSFEDQMSLTSYFKFDFKCRKCGTAYVGSLELPDGKLEIREQ